MNHAAAPLRNLLRTFNFESAFDPVYAILQLYLYQINHVNFRFYLTDYNSAVFPRGSCFDSIHSHYLFVLISRACKMTNEKKRTMEKSKKKSLKMELT